MLLDDLLEIENYAYQRFGEYVAHNHCYLDPSNI